jgi:hypothetical protein
LLFILTPYVLPNISSIGLFSTIEQVPILDQSAAPILSAIPTMPTATKVVAVDPLNLPEWQQ